MSSFEQNILSPKKLSLISRYNFHNQFVNIFAHYFPCIFIFSFLDCCVLYFFYCVLFDIFDYCQQLILFPVKFLELSRMFAYLQSFSYWWKLYQKILYPISFYHLYHLHKPSSPVNFFPAYYNWRSQNAFENFFPMILFLLCGMSLFVSFLSLLIVEWEKSIYFAICFWVLGLPPFSLNFDIKVCLYSPKFEFESVFF